MAGSKTGELIRRHGISRETFYYWRRAYGGMKSDAVKRWRTLDDENRRLKRVVADQAPNIQGAEGRSGERELTMEQGRTIVQG